jgi:hypothetical protein
MYTASVGNKLQNGEGGDGGQRKSRDQVVFNESKSDEDFGEHKVMAQEGRR